LYERTGVQGTARINDELARDSFDVGLALARENGKRIGCCRERRIRQAKHLGLEVFAAGLELQDVACAHLLARATT